MGTLWGGTGGRGVAGGGGRTDCMESAPQRQRGPPGVSGQLRVPSLSAGSRSRVSSLGGRLRSIWDRGHPNPATGLCHPRQLQATPDPLQCLAGSGRGPLGRPSCCSPWPSPFPKKPQNCTCQAAGHPAIHLAHPGLLGPDSCSSSKTLQHLFPLPFDVWGFFQGQLKKNKPPNKQHPPPTHTASLHLKLCNAIVLKYWYSEVHRSSATAQCIRDYTNTEEKLLHALRSLLSTPPHWYYTMVIILESIGLHYQWHRG